MGKQSRWDRFRQWVAGLLFLTAGRVHESYDVWLDDAPRREPTDTGSEPEPTPQELRTVDMRWDGEHGVYLPDGRTPTFDAAELAEYSRLRIIEAAARELVANDYDQLAALRAALRQD